MSYRIGPEIIDVAIGMQSHFNNQVRWRTILEISNEFLLHFNFSEYKTIPNILERFDKFVKIPAF
jgi:hypothetical protein